MFGANVKLLADGALEDVHLLALHIGSRLRGLNEAVDGVLLTFAEILTQKKHRQYIELIAFTGEGCYSPGESVMALPKNLIHRSGRALREG